MPDHTPASHPATRSVTKAVFPVAGLGTRFLPATKAQPKEMLPIVDKPLIQYAVEEAYAAGIRHMIFVTGRSKRAIEDHFDAAYELEAELEAAAKHELLKLVRSVQPEDMNCSYVRQPRSLGLGHAVLCAENLVGNSPFAVLLADDLMLAAAHGVGPLQQMVQQFESMPLDKRGCIVAVQQVPPEHTRRYGMVGGTVVSDRLMKLDRFVEKPAPENAPSTWGVSGRYVLTPEVFAAIRSQPRGVGGEIQLTDGIAALMTVQSVYAYQYEGSRFDCGSKQGFLQATVELALRHPEVGAEFAQYLAQRVK
ncbi:MAG: UTP--glucose-1-phosphate uridylyltransferase GalU [Burkholderiaceae bacterium]